MTVRTFALALSLVCLLALIPRDALPAATTGGGTSAECGGGQVPQGVWPNCSPCAGEAGAAMARQIMARSAEILDQTVVPVDESFLERCLGGILDGFWPGGNVRVADFLEMACLVLRGYAMDAVSKLRSAVGYGFSATAPYGLASVDAGFGHWRPGVTVASGAGADAEALKRRLRPDFQKALPGGQ